MNFDRKFRFKSLTVFDSENKYQKINRNSSEYNGYVIPQKNSSIFSSIEKSKGFNLNKLIENSSPKNNNLRKINSEEESRKFLRIF